MKRMALGAALACVWAATAQAGLYDDIYRGLAILSIPSGSPVNQAADGSLVNGQRSGRLLIQPNVPGRGFDIEFNRVFGLDSGGRPEVLDLGQFEIQLSGATQATFGYTNRGVLIGSATINASNLNYALRAKSGIQDVTLTGTMNVAEHFELDEFGFYRATVNISNTNSELILDGSLAQETVPEDFDIGPISIKGNIFFDGFVALLSGLGVDTSQLEQLFPGSPIDQITNAIAEQVPQLVAGLQVTGDGQLPPVPDSIDAALLIPSVELTPTTPVTSPTIPEPSVLLLISLGGLFVRHWTRR